MNKNISGLDMIKAAEYFDVLGLQDYDLDFSAKYSRFKDVVNFFSRYEDGRKRLISILMRHPGMDKLDVAYMFLEMYREREKYLSELMPEDFAPEIEAELREGKLSYENKKRIMSDLKNPDSYYDQETISKYSEIMNKINTIDKELKIYE